MLVRQLSLSQFRNLGFQKVTFGGRVNIFLGQNGQGKTNLLEALNLVLGGIPFRNAHSVDLVDKRLPEQDKTARIQANIEIDQKSFLAACHISHLKKTYELGGKLTSISRFRNLFPRIVFSPESLSSIKSGPEERRHLIDEALILHDEAGVLAVDEYSKVLRTRNRLLTTLKNQHIPKSSDRDVLGALRPLFLEKATQLSLARIRVLQELSPLLNQVFHEIMDPNVDISVEYVISDQIANDWESPRIYDALVQRLVDLEVNEIKVGHSLVGPHKHDLRILYDRNDSRFYCSQGQQRALILAFKIAQIVYHRRVHKVRPLLLLDDVLSELDESRRRYLVDFLGKNDSQTLITTTDLEVSRYFESSTVRLFGVATGCIEENSWPKKK